MMTTAAKYFIDPTKQMRGALRLYECSRKAGLP